VSGRNDDNTTRRAPKRSSDEAAWTHPLVLEPADTQLNLILGKHRDLLDIVIMRGYSPRPPHDQIQNQLSSFLSSASGSVSSADNENDNDNKSQERNPDEDSPPKAIHPPGANNGENNSIHADMRAESRFFAYDELERW
jgi:hypothetical protein